MVVVVLIVVIVVVLVGQFIISISRKTLSCNYFASIDLITIIIITIIIFIETRLQDTFNKIIKYRWLG